MEEVGGDPGDHDESDAISGETDSGDTPLSSDSEAETLRRSSRIRKPPPVFTYDEIGGDPKLL